MIPLLIATIFMFALAFLYLRFPTQIWNRFLRPGFGGVAVSESTGYKISRTFGFIAITVGLGLLTVLLFGFLHVKS